MGNGVPGELNKLATTNLLKSVEALGGVNGVVGVFELVDLFDFLLVGVEEELIVGFLLLFLMTDIFKLSPLLPVERLLHSGHM